ncbi:stage II sporulation protein M [Paenibacillus rhizosphaerae]|uniref:Stage II sporulation protein M n=1 Tax=Paenibacillus rhizosphaerae TaxID=297318 RepID=A0A839U2P5_9BACL|nr:stage II sporulation protein M [Paenibacillus rhizosphaerae]MBB3132020.1 stage II sporulation protein M [Paenibacillus rhizosphaerae]
MSIKKTLLFALLLFAAGVAAGWISTGALADLVDQQLSGLREVSGNLQNSEHPQWSFFGFIFLNNSIKGVLIIYLGLLVGILPVMFLLVNGMVIGYLVHSLSTQGENLADLVVRGLLPHGIIEIPAIIIACAYGIRMGSWVISGINPGRRARVRKGEGVLRKSVTAAFWVVILLFVAAIIESTVTYALMQN